MSYVRPLGPIVPSGDGYETFWTPNCAYAQIQVVNGAIDYSVAQGGSTMQATFSVPDDTLLPGSGPILGPLQAIRFKAHAPTSNPAPQVSIRAEKALPLGVSLSPAWTPSYATIDAAGAIGATFTGHVNARGVDLPSDSSGSSKVTWYDQNGVLVAEIYGEQDGDLTNHLWLHAAPGPDTIAQVSAVAGGVQRLIIDQGGQSSFQVDMTLRERVLRGSVTAAGVLSTGTGWSAARTPGAPVGDYTITFDSPFNLTPIALATPVAPSGTRVGLTQVGAGVTVNTFQYQTFTPSTGALVDAACRFAVLGR